MRVKDIEDWDTVLGEVGRRFGEIGTLGAAVAAVAQAIGGEEAAEEFAEELRNEVYESIWGLQHFAITMGWDLGMVGGAAAMSILDFGPEARFLCYDEDPDTGRDWAVACKFDPADLDKIKAAIAEEVSDGMVGNGQALGAGATSITIWPPLTRADIRAAHLMSEEKYSKVTATGWQSIAETMEATDGESFPYDTRQEREALLDVYLDACLKVEDGPSWAELQ